MPKNIMNIDMVFPTMSYHLTIKKCIKYML